MLSLSKYERTLQRLFKSFPGQRLERVFLLIFAFPILTLRQASFDRLRTGKANGLERRTPKTTRE
ncbi:MAG: hypothetical protein LBD67_01435 [Candidatus Accumulibacter sp.]|nr:hypothetical protein [Accumulibacter sp.]